MSSAVYDSSAVDNYVNELSRREAEVTRSRQIDNFIREVPYIALKWCAYVLPIALLIWFLGNAISNALSYERTVRNESITQTSYGEGEQTNRSQDELIDVDRILASGNSGSNSFPEVENAPLLQAAVRDYYIFDTIPFDHPLFEQVVVGRRYDEPDSLPVEEFCYINVWQADGMSKRLNFIIIDEDGRNVIDINQSTSNTLNISLTDLKAARSKCTI